MSINAELIIWNALNCGRMALHGRPFRTRRRRAQRSNTGRLPTTLPSPKRSAAILLSGLQRSRPDRLTRGHKMTRVRDRHLQRERERERKREREKERENNPITWKTKHFDGCQPRNRLCNFSFSPSISLFPHFLILLSLLHTLTLYLTRIK